MSPQLVVAHRAGNDLGTLRAALDAGADLVEADVHAFRQRLEVRHLKSLGPWWLWDRGEFVRRRDTRLLELGDLLAALNGDPRLLLDLKGIHPRLARRLAAVLPDSTVTVCTQHWWMLDAFRDLPHVRLVLSAGSRRGLRRLRTRLRARPAYGVSVHRRLLTPDLVTELHRRAELVFTWPVDTEDELGNARHLGVDGVIGKNLGLLR
ncbi:glycerophosphoryl diester phosphodiesterase [Kribbella orskensis]|uniref:Glycerophosphoryl diester phosphodiesterase n=1 Tax=Kribbella orskensis TaxID=2512216 RepID=A0ABY2B8H1_9ACTN|nr:MULTISPECIES: glycerophosphodiester phosphodiesterase [Kribbella]TCN31164.1 glycerophosphoryl diester phosphodiesterase [Kribbella sp. VKM Ac-2500]TCO11670.1 glycerophosphoryl diester phosphodiesterase [Kribbella orskensis]